MAENDEQQGLPCPVCGQYFKYLQQHLERKNDEDHRAYRNGDTVPDQGQQQETQKRQKPQSQEPQQQKPQQQRPDNMQDPQEMFGEPDQNPQASQPGTQKQVQQSQQGQTQQSEKYVTGPQQPQQVQAPQQGQNSQSFPCPSCSQPWQKGTQQHQCGETFDCPKCGNALRPYAEKKCRCGYNLPGTWDEVLQK
jgi:predicted RNA-binding Zn-ribbon protein involved in translation (DUF1610 family)